MSETGNAKNAANFEQLANIVGNLGAAYNPSQNLIKLPNLLTKLADAQTALTAVNTKEAAETAAVNRRDAGFKVVGKLATRIGNAADLKLVSAKVKLVPAVLKLFAAVLKRASDAVVSLVAIDLAVRFRFETFLIDN